MAIDELEVKIFAKGADHEEAVEELFKLAFLSNDRATSLKAGIILKEAGYLEKSISVFTSALATLGFDDQITYELIQVYRRMNNHAEADAVLLAGLKSGGGCFLTKELAFRTCIDVFSENSTNVELISELIKHLDFHPSPGDREVDYLSAFINFVVSSKSDIQRIRHFYAHTPLSSPDMVFRIIQQALYDGKPFAMVRFGDGEGAFLDGVSQSRAEQALHDRHKRYFLKRWFGDDLLLGDLAFEKYMKSLVGRLDQIDVIGLPEYSWFEHERNGRNVSTVTNCMRAVSATCRYAQSAVVTNTSIHIDLEYRGMLSKLISLARDVVLVTSHKSLEARLRTNLGHENKANLRTILIPPAASDLAETGYSLAKSDFFSRHAQIRAEIATSVDDATLVLVSAGFLGKEFCLDVKSEGGIALDIGSVTDLWMGFQTRPNFAGLQKLVLK
jgi:hypothetical protein